VAQVKIQFLEILLHLVVVVVVTLRSVLKMELLVVLEVVLAH
jgi:hypothetical protein